MKRSLFTVAATGAMMLAIAPAARSAESYDACGGRFIDTLPATITSEGIWCLRKDLATGIASGAAIEIKAGNVTIDCNGFKVGGLQAGRSTQAIGILADYSDGQVPAGRMDTTVRRCNVRGFLEGIYVVGGDVLIEDNRVEGSLELGIGVSGHGVIRRNLVIDIGGPEREWAGGISGRNAVDIIDNTIDGVVAGSVGESGASAVGISHRPGGGVIRGNRVRGLDSVGEVYGVFSYFAGGFDLGGLLIAGNTLAALAGPAGAGIMCAGPEHGYQRDNLTGGFAVATTGCTDADPEHLP